MSSFSSLSNERPSEPASPSSSSIPGSPAVKGDASPASRGFWGKLSPIKAQPGDDISSRKLTALNSGLQRAWEQSNPVSWAIARVRCEIFRLTPHELSAEHGHLPHSTLHGLEDARDLHSARYNPETITLLFRGWDEIALQRGDKRTARLIKEAKSEIVSCLTARQPSKTYGVMLGWRYIVGPECFKDLTKLDYKNLWARSHSLYLPDFSEALSYGRNLGFVPVRSSPPAIWKNESAAALREAWIEDCVTRDRPREMSRLHTVLGAAGILLSAETLGPTSEIRLSHRTIASLSRFEPVPWQKVSPLYDHLHSKGLISSEYLAEARDAWQAEDRARPQLACVDLQELARQRGLTNRDLAEALGIPDKLARKPVLPVFRTLSYDEPSALAPFGALAHLICADDQQLERVLEKKRHEIAAWQRRAGSAIQSPVAIERQLWSLSYQDLPFEKREIQRLEWKGKDPVREREIAEAIRGLGEARAAESLARLSQAQDTSRVAPAIRSLVLKHGLAPLESKLGSSARLLKAISLGEEVPSLPRLRQLLDRAEIPLSPALELDWRLRSAQHQALYCQSDLERAVNCHTIEVAENRRQLLSASTKIGGSAARSLIHLSVTSAASPKIFRRTLKAMKVPPESVRSELFKSLLSDGSIARFLAQRLEAAADPARLRESLQHTLAFNSSSAGSGQPLAALRLQRRGEVPDDPRLQQALTFLADIPGVTPADIARALKGDFARPEVELHRSLLERATSRKLPLKAIPFVAGQNVSLVRKQPDLILEAARAALPSPAFPLGVAALLAAKDMASHGQHLADVSQAVSAELQALGVPVTELAIQMRAWGIRPHDLAVPQKELQSALWSPTEELQQRALQLVADIRLAKAERSLERATLREGAVTPAEIVRCARESVSGGDRTISGAVGLAFGALIDFESGRIVPPLYQLRAIAKQAGISFTQEMTVRWAWAYAESLQRAGHSPAFRMLVTNILLAQTEGTPAGRASGVEAIRDFVARSGLPLQEYSRAFKRLRKEGQITMEHATAILAALGHDAKSLEGLFLAACTSSASMPEALSNWASRASGFDRLDASLESLCEATTPSAPSSSASGSSSIDAALERKLASNSRVNLSAEACRLALNLAGSTPAEIQAAKHAILKERALRASEKHQEEIDRAEELARLEAERIRTKAQTIPGAPWRPSPEQLALPFDARITLLAGRLRHDVRVTPSEVLELFSRERQLIEPLSREFGQELAWLIGTLDAYKYPDSALAVMKQELRKGLFFREPGKVLFMRNMEWLDSRGSSGKLNESSLKLFFVDRPPPPPLKISSDD